MKLNSPDNISNGHPHVFEFVEFSFDAKDKVLFKSGEIIQLAPKACELLDVFIKNAGKILSKDELMNQVWADSFVEEANLTHHISALRKALGEDKNGRKFIETIPRKGYRFVAPVNEVPNGAAEIVFSEKISARAVEEVEIETDDDGKIQTAESPLLLPKKSRSRQNYLKILLPAGLILLLAISFFAFRMWRQNKSLRSFDALRSVKLTAWKSAGGSEFWDFKSAHNGNMIAYSSSKDGHSAIYLKQIGGGEDIRITRDESNNSSPIWSPDDRQIMFASVRDGQSGIYSCASLGGTATLVKIIGEGSLSLRYWSSDGTAIYYEFDGNLFKLTLENKESAPLTKFTPEPGVNRYFRVSPDEKSFSFSLKIGDKSDLQILEIASGKVSRLIEGADMVVESAWSPDGAGLFYQVRRNDVYRILFADTNGGEPVQVTRGDQNVELIDVSPDGRRLFYYTSEDRSDIGGVNIETGEQFDAANETDSEFWSHAAPDGGRISYLSNSHQYALPRLPDSNVVVHSINDKSNPIIFKGLNQKWLPDSRRIAFLRFDDTAQIYNLWVFDATNGAEKQITTAGIAAPATATFPFNRSQTRDFSWSPDSRKVLYSDAKRRNIFLKTDGGESINLTNNENPNLNFHCPLWSPDGKQFAFVSALKPMQPEEKPKWSVWLDEGGAAREIFTTEQSLRFLGWSKTGEMLFEATDGVMKSAPIDLKILQVAPSGANRVLNSFEMISAFSMTLAPNAESVVFTKETNGKNDLYLAPVNGGETKKLTANVDAGMFFGSPTWLPDGKTVYFDKQERINTISMFENLK